MTYIVRNENIRTDKEIENEKETDIQRNREIGREDTDRKTFYVTGTVTTQVMKAKK
jgi:hypothetical protein